jgi:colicin import membrane protein
MRHALNIGKEPKFHVIVVTSAVIHLLLITFIVVPLKTRTREYSSYFVSLVGPVETPAGINSNENTVNIPASLTEKAETKGLTRPLSKADMSLEPDKQISKEIERIRALSALSKHKKRKEEAKGHDIEVIRQKILGSASMGPGIPSALQSTGADSYYAIITRKIWSEWIYPESDLSGLEVIINIKIDNEGNVITHEIEKSSGNTLFDRSAVKAISKASPLPPPPVEMEIGVRFYL